MSCVLMRGVSELRILMSPADRKFLKATKGRRDDIDRAIDAIRAGGDPNTRDEYNLPAFTWCARKGHIRVAQALKAAGADLEARDRCGARPFIMQYSSAVWNSSSICSASRQISQQKSSPAARLLISQCSKRKIHGTIR